MCWVSSVNALHHVPLTAFSQQCPTRERILSSRTRTIDVAHEKCGRFRQFAGRKRGNLGFNAGFETSRIATIAPQSPRIDLRGLRLGTETKREIWLLWTWFYIAPGISWSPWRGFFGTDKLLKIYITLHYNARRSRYRLIKTLSVDHAQPPPKRTRSHSAATAYSSSFAHRSRWGVASWCGKSESPLKRQKWSDNIFSKQSTDGVMKVIRSTTVLALFTTLSK